MRWMEQTWDKCSYHRPGSSGAVYLKMTVVHHDGLQFRRWQTDSAYWHEDRSENVVTRVLFYIDFNTSCTPWNQHWYSASEHVLHAITVTHNTAVQSIWRQVSGNWLGIGRNLSTECIVVLCVTTVTKYILINDTTGVNHLKISEHSYQKNLSVFRLV